ncbi:MAG: hypothetical protein K8R19_00645 [Methanosarcinales archaeon]|nr:hypothetical protein [Methanosarcinales archaeon]
MKLRLNARAGGIHAKQYAVSFLLPSSRQDVEEGVIRWEFGRPYLIAHDDDGYYVHLDRENYRCMVWE